MFFRSFSFVLLFLFVGTSNAAPQQVEIPPDLDELIQAAQTARTLLSEGKMIEVIEFIVPDKRNQVLAAGRPTFRNPEVIGVDLTDDPARVVVRVSVEMPAVGLGTERAWTARDTWIRVDGRWLFEPANYSGTWAAESISAPGRPSPEELLKEISDSFRLVKDFFDVGTINEGERLAISVPIEYSGNSPIRIANSVPSNFLILDGASTRAVRSTDTSFNLILDSEGWDGPFRFPLPLTVEYQGVTIEQTLTVAGNVFAPLTFGVLSVEDSSPDDIRLYLRNNTEQRLEIIVNAEGKVAIEDHSTVLDPMSEGSIHFRRLPDVDPPNKFTVFVTPPVLGRQNFSFSFDFTSR
jgi:hypothetical protein